MLSYYFIHVELGQSMPRASWASQSEGDWGSLSPAIHQPRGCWEDMGGAQIQFASLCEDAVAISVLLSLLDHTERVSVWVSCVLNHINYCESPFSQKDSSSQL